MADFTGTAALAGSGTLTLTPKLKTVVVRANAWTGSGTLVASQGWMTATGSIYSYDWNGGNLTATGALQSGTPAVSLALSGDSTLSGSGVSAIPLDSQIQIIDVDPDSLTVALVDTTPGTTITFTVDGVVAYTTTSDSNGFLAPFSLPLPYEYDAGTTHTLGVSMSDGTLPSSTTFTAVSDANRADITQGPDAKPQAVPSAHLASGVYRWVLQDLMPGGLGSYVLEQNPSQMTSPHFERQLATVHTTALGDGKFHVHESGHVPHNWQFSGFCPSQAMHDKLRAYADLKRRIYIIDHRNRAWLAVILNVELKARRRLTYQGAQTDWAHDYTVTASIYDQNWKTPA